MDARPRGPPSPEPAGPVAPAPAAAPRGTDGPTPVRNVELLDGLALLGRGPLGPFWVDTPGVIWSNDRVPADPARGTPTTLRTAPSPGPGSRSLELRQGGAIWGFSYAVPAPEVSGIPGTLADLGEGSWLLRWPLSAAEWTELAADRPRAVVLANARSLWSEGEPFVRAIADLREHVGASPLLWAPRVALPHRLAFLSWVSVDLVDSTAALWRASEGGFLDRNLGELPAESARRERACACLGCRTPGEGDLASHAVEELEAELALARTTLRAGRLRELVEARLTAEPALAEMLRYADRVLAGRLEERTPVVGDAVRTYVLREAFRRPEVARFRARFLERYRPPPSKTVLVLVPCSKTKPYRTSRSHRRFSSAVRDLPHAERLHFTSVTSPLGVVPRELEDLHPARHYDIPVTGDWDESERAAVVRSVEHLLASAPYRSVVVHLDPEEYSFLRAPIESLLPARWTLSGGSTTTSAALASLRAAAEESLRTAEPTRTGPMATVREELASIARMQFGTDAAERLFAPPVWLRGRPWFQRVTDGEGHDLATWQERNGLFRLTVPGARRIHPYPEGSVELADDVDLKGDVFTPGVVAAGSQVRTGDSVVLVGNGEVRGVGEAAMPGPLMLQLRRGLAVQVRHRAHPPSGGGPPTGT